MLKKPVIIGVGQASGRPPSAPGRDPLTLMRDASRAALLEVPGIDLSAIDSVDVVDVMSWRYAPNAAVALATALGLDVRRAEESPVGGEQPLALVDRVASEVARGQIRAGLVAGAEAQATLRAARKAGAQVSWPDKPPRRDIGSSVQAIVHPEMWRHGLRAPVSVYPLFENAFRAKAGIALAAAQEETGRIWAGMSREAVDNPFAWDRTPHSAEEIETATPRNRPIFHPFTKLMTAQPYVDLGAAVLVTSEDQALAWGVPPEQMVHLVAAAGAREIRDPLARSSFARSLAMEVTLDTLLERGRMNIGPKTGLELYSCFPCVPKMAAAHLSPPANTCASMAGGLTFFGGPGSNYMLHAVAAAVSRIRSSQVSDAVLYGQGEFVTKHHALAIASRAPADGYAGGGVPSVVQDAIYGQAAPDVTTTPRGSGTIETFTAAWQPDGAPGVGIIVGRLDASGQRFVANSAPDDDAFFNFLVDGRQEPIGAAVIVTPGDERNLVRLSTG